jgi:hypothetical protein
MSLNLTTITSPVKKSDHQANYDQIESTYNEHVVGTSDRHDTDMINNESNESGTTLTDALDNNKARVDNLIAGSANIDSGVFPLSSVAGTDTYTGSYSGIVAYTTGLKVTITIPNTNTGASSLNVNSISAKSIKIVDESGSKQDLPANILKANKTYLLQYDGTDFVIVGEDIVDSSTEATETASIIDFGSDTVDGGMTKLEIEGVTTVNLLDDDVAGCESTSGWTVDSGLTLSTDNSNNLEETNCLKLALTADSSGKSIYRDVLSLLDTSNYYLIAITSRNNDLSTGVKLQVNCIGDLGVIATANSTETSYVRQGLLLQPTDFDTATEVRIQPIVAGLNTEFGFVDAISLIKLPEGATDYALGADACMAKYPFSRNIGQTLPKEIISRGKNIFDLATLKKGYYLNSGVFTSTTGNYFATEDFTLIPDTLDFADYSGKVNLSGSVIEYYTKNFTFISAQLLSVSLVKPDNAVYSRVYFRTVSDVTTYTNTDFTCVLSEAASTTYESYKGVPFYTPQLNAVPAISDVLDALKGVVTRNVKRYVLTADDITAFVTSATNINYAVISKNADYDGYNTTADIDGRMLLQSSIGDITYADDSSIIGYIFTASTTTFGFAVSKTDLDITDLASAKAALAGKVIYYQLATPYTEEITPMGLVAHKSGSIVQDGVVKFQSTATSAGVITIPNSDNEKYYVNAVKEVIGVETGKVMTVDSNTDTTITIDDSTGEEYEVTYYLNMTYSLGTITESHALNDTSAIQSNSQGTTEISSGLNRKVDSLQETKVNRQELSEAKGDGFSQADLERWYRNSKPIWMGEQDGTWIDNNWNGTAGTYSADTTNVLWGDFSVKLTTSTNFGGISLDFTDKDMTLFIDGSESLTSDYIIFKIFTPTASYANLPSTALTFGLPSNTIGSITDAYFKTIAKTELVDNGTSYHAFKKSEFSTVGSPDWSDIKGCYLEARGTLGGQVDISISAIQLVRVDPEDSTQYNYFQHQIDDGVYVNDAVWDGGSEFILGEENGKVRLKDLGDGTNIDAFIFGKNYSANSDFVASLTSVMGSGGDGGYLVWFIDADNYISCQLAGTTLTFRLRVGGSATDNDVTLSLNEGQTLKRTLKKIGNNFSILIKVDGILQELDLPSHSYDFAGLSGNLCFGSINNNPCYIESATITSTKVADFANTSSLAYNLTPQPYCKVRNSSTQSIPDSADTLLLYDTVISDKFNMFDSDNSRILIPESGLYDIDIAFQFAANSSSFRVVYVKINGSTIIRLKRTLAIDASTAVENTLKFTHEFSKNDYMEVYYRQETGAPLGANSSSERYQLLTVSKIG